MAEKQSKWKIFTAGILRENPVLRLVLGCCSALAITTTVSGAIGMGLSMTFVLVCSNIVISALRKAIPDKVHLPCYIVIIAAFVTIVQMVLQAYVPDLYESLGVFLALIVVNCIILGRAEMFACKHTVVESALDGLGMGLGYILTMTPDVLHPRDFGQRQLDGHPDHPGIGRPHGHHEPGPRRVLCVRLPDGAVHLHRAQAQPPHRAQNLRRCDAGRAGSRQSRKWGRG